MINVMQLYSIAMFLGANFQEVNCNERAYFTIKKKKKISAILRLCFLQDIMGKI